MVVKQEGKVTNSCVIRPTPSRVVVEVDPFKYSGLIAIPDKHQRTPTTGTVVAIGETITKFHIGDRVAFGMYSGTGLVLRDKNTNKDLPMLRVVTEDEILGWLNENTELVEAGS